MLIALACGLAFGAGAWGMGRSEEGGRTGVLVNGIVVDLSGAPIAGATVRAWRLGPAETLRAFQEAEETASTDAGGRFRLPVVRGEYVLQARHMDFAAASVRYGSAGSTDPTIRLCLAPAGAISGRVVERATGRGVAGASVNISGELGIGSLPGDAHPPVTAAPDGSFSARGLRPGIIRLTAFRDGLRTSEPLTVPLSAGKSFAGATLEVDSTWSASGFVRDRTDPSHGVAGVWLDARDEFTGEVMPASAPTGPDGSFAVPGLWSSRYDLEVRREGAFPRPTGASVAIADADVRNLALLIDAGVTVRGRVQPAADAWVRMDPLGPDGLPVADGALDARLTTAANGAFSFANVESGELALVAGTSDGRRGSVVARLAPPGLEGVVVPLEIMPRRTKKVCNENVRGTVLDAQGMLAAGVVVSIGGDDPGVPWLLTDDRGEFSFPHVCGGHNGLTVADPYSTGRAVLSRVQPGGPLTIQLVEAPTLEGVVRSADGKVVPYTMAVVGLEVRYLRITREDGRFRLPLLSPGSYQLLAEADDGYAVALEVLPQVSPRQVSLSLTAWSALHGQLVDRERRGLPEIDVRLEAAYGRQVWYTKTDGDGRFSFERVAIKGPAFLSLGRRGTAIHVLDRPSAPRQALPSPAEDPLLDNSILVKLQPGQDLQLPPTEVAGE